MLFSTSIANLALQWKLTNVCFIDNGQSMLSAFTCNINLETTGYSLAANILGYVQCTIADGLLVMSIFANIIL